MDTDLFKMLKRHSEYSEADRKSMMKMALTGLKVIHDQDYIHFDIKPDNLFFSQSSDSHSFDASDLTVLYTRGSQDWRSGKSC